MRERWRRSLWMILGAAVAYGLAITVLTFVESRHTEANIDSVPTAIWYSFVTLSTVGYGDYYPVTPLGQLIGLGFILGSLGLLGLLVGESAHLIGEARERRRMGWNGTNMKNHVVILGWSGLARSIARQLLRADRQVSIVCAHREDMDHLRDAFSEDDVFGLYADLANLEKLARANIADAQAVVVHQGDDAAKLIEVINARAMYPHPDYVVMLDNPDLRNTFVSAGVTYTLSAEEISAKMLASFTFEPDVAAFTTDLLSSTDAAGEFDVQQYLVEPENPLAGKSYGEALHGLRDGHRCLLIGLARPNGDGRELLKLPPDDTQIEPGDYLVVIADGESEAAMVELCGVQEGVVRRSV